MNEWTIDPDRHTVSHDSGFVVEVDRHTGLAINIVSLPSTDSPQSLSKLTIQAQLAYERFRKTTSS